MTSPQPKSPPTASAADRGGDEPSWGWRAVRLLLALAWAVWTLAGTIGCQPKPCYYCGSYYDFGERFRTFDLCNECRCVQDPVTQLGRVECSAKNQCAGYCYWDGKKYSSQETLLINGECATCNCAPGYYKRFEKCGGLTFCLALRKCDP